MAESENLSLFEAHGYKWRAVASFAGAIAEDPRAASPEEARLVEAGTARRVWRFKAGEAPDAVEAIVTQYLLPDLPDRLRCTLRPSRARREWRTLRELRRRGVHAPEPLAVGARRRGPFLHASILVTKAPGDALPLERFVLEHMEAASHGEVAAFTGALASFLRRMHGAGVLHRRFHAESIMVAGGPSAPRFSLANLHGVRVGEGPLHGERLESAAALGRFFCLVVPRHWRLRFLKRYLDGKSDYRAAARLVERTAERGMRRMWARRDRRVFGTNRYFRQVRLGRLLGHRRRAPEAVAALRLLEAAEPFETADSIIKSPPPSTVAAFTVEADGKSHRILVKRHKPRRRWKAVFDPFRTSRGKKGFFFGAAFEHRGLPSPRVYAALDERCFGCMRASYLATEYIEGAENLGEIMARRELSPLYVKLAANKTDFLTRLAHALRRMHWCGFSVRDLKSANVLVYESDGRIDFSVCDLDGARLYTRGVPERRAIRNIARLYFDVAWFTALTRREAIGFLRSYLGPADRKRLLKWVRVIARFVKEKRVTFKPEGLFRRRL